MSESAELLKFLYSMQYTENYHLNVLSPDLEFLHQNQHEENLRLKMQEAQLPADFEMNPVIPLEGENLMDSLLKFDNGVKRKAIFDRGACANAMPASSYEKLRDASPNSLSDLKQAAFLYVKVASGRNVKFLGQIDVEFKNREHRFKDTFRILPPMNSVVLGNPLIRKYSIKYNPAENILKLPEITYEWNEKKLLVKDVKLFLNNVIQL